MHRERLAHYFALPSDAYSRFELACVVGSSQVELLFKRVVRDHGISHLLLHNQDVEGETVEVVARDYIDDLANQQVSAFARAHALAMSYDAGFELGVIFFDADLIPRIGRYGDVLSEARSQAYPLLEYLEALNSRNRADVAVWRATKAAEDERLLRTGHFL